MQKQIGRYNIIEALGQGGFATVYHAFDTELNRPVALKQLKPALLNDAASVESFRREAQTIAQLDHPRIITVHDIYETDDSDLFIVMRLVRGPSLDEMLRTHGPLAWRDALDMLAAIAEALDYAHAHNILHRDLKPANILLDAVHGPQLGDFGLALLKGEADDNNIVGTPHYIAPEVWQDSQSSPQSDIYALACTFYEMVMGQRLVAGDTPPRIMMAHLEGPELPSAWPPDIPPDLSRILSKATAKNPSDRHENAAALLAELQQLEMPPPQSTRPQPRLLETKLYIPQPRPNSVARPRLVHRLESGLAPGCKLILISASAGFGKTTLVAAWLQASERRSAWLSLDADDNDPSRFITYLVAALQRLDPTIGATLMAMPKLPPTDTALTLLINDLAKVSQPFILVLDDYHIIQNSLIYQMTEFLLDHQPPHMHLVMTTREDPPLPLPRMRVRGHAVEIRQRDLRFTVEEVTQFLNQTMGLALDSAAVEALEARTEGWIAGLQLAGLSLQRQSPDELLSFIDAFSGSHRYIIDYLVEEVSQQQPRHVQQFLRQTAILDRLSVGLCNAVTERSDAAHILDLLEQANLFLIPLDDQREWYRYHHLFAEFLRTDLDPDETATLHRRAAHWFAENDSPSEAIRYALAAEDFALAQPLILAAMEEVLHRGALITGLNWLDALPEELIKQTPDLAIFKAILLWLMGKGHAAEAYIAIAEAQFSESTPDSLRGRAMAVKASILSLQDIKQVKLAEEAMTLLDQDDTIFRGFMLLLIGELNNFLGEAHEAIATLQEALELSRRHGDYMMSIGAVMNIAQQLNWLGRRREAMTLYEQSLAEFGTVGGAPLPMGGLLYIGLAELEAHAYNLDEAEAYLERGSTQMREQQTFMSGTAAINLAQALIEVGRGRAGKAVTLMQEVMDTLQRGRFDLVMPFMNALRAEYQLRAGQRLAAEQWAREVDPYTLAPFTLIKAREGLVYGRLLLAQGKAEAALTVLAPIEAQLRQRQRGLGIMLLLVARALALHALNREEEADAALTEAVKLAAPEAYRSVFLDEGAAIAPLLQRVQAAAPAFVADLLTRLDALPAIADEQVLAHQPLVEPLSERELEVLQLVAAGKSNKEIAQSLVITIGTVKKHLSNVYGKLAVKNRTEAVAEARQIGLLG